MCPTREPLALRAALALVRWCSLVTPAAYREDWRTEWEAEVRHRWYVLDRDDRLNWRTRMDLVRRALGALPDAAWLRRQFTADADVIHDVRHGARLLLRSPSYSLSAVLILALGLGGTLAIVTLLDTLQFRPLAYQGAEAVVTIWQRQNTGAGEREDVSPGDFLDWRSRAKSFSSMAGVIPYSMDFTGGTTPEMLFGAQVTEGFFDTIGMPPLLGRGFLPDEHTRGGRRAVVITYGFWQSRYAGNPDILNTTISMDGEPWTIVGVLPKAFAPQLLPRPGELSVWTPKVLQEHEQRIRASGWWNVVARLAPGVTVEQAQAEMNSIAAVIAAENPRTNSGRGAAVITLREHLMGGVRLPLMLMLAAVVLVLGIGCANVASLMLARGIARGREFAIRSALGAGQIRLVRQLVAESLLLSLVSAAVGLALAHWTIAAVVALAPRELVRLREASIDGRVFLFALGLTMLTALVFGLIPATQFASGGTTEGRAVLRERQGGTFRGSFRRGLVAAEVAIALVLLAGAGLLVKSFGRLMAVDPGFQAQGVVMAQVFAGDRNGGPVRSRAFLTSVIDKLRVVPGIQAAGAVSAMPFALSNINIQSTFDIVGRPAPSERERRGTYLTIASPGYFAAMSIPLREGRFLEERDSETAPIVAVISEGLRRREWPDESPIGRRVQVSWQGKPVEAEVVGVVSQIRHDGLDQAARAEVFLPLKQFPFASMTFVAKGGGDPAALIQSVKAGIWAVDPLQAVYEAESLERLVHTSLVRHRFSMSVMAAVALIALLLCASGIYAIVSFTTAQRTREIGVRMALGADGPVIRRMVLAESAKVILVGLVLGGIGTLLASRALRTLLFEVRPSDPLTIVVVALLLAGVGFVACYVPARRATRVDPLIALRTD